MVNISMIDLITVVFSEELGTLKWQAKSIDLYCQNINLGKIFVVINDDTMSINEIKPEWWGRFSNQVCIIHRDSWPYNFVDNGWVTQQVIKLMTSEFGIGKWSLVLDAKTIFVKKVDPIEEQPKVGIMDIQPVFEPSRKVVSDLFGIKLTKQLGPGGVPFVLNNALTKEMMKEITICTGTPFASWFQKQGMVTEFILYSGYVVYKFGNFDAMYNTNQNAIIPCNLCHSEVTSFDRKFREMAQSTTVSIHRKAWSQLTVQQQQKYVDFLVGRGIQ